ncbi:dual specificity protein phosphatase 19 [Lucilia sericata]|uniref:dual specificity protein phosphatase 19 n=1 Tax=Lucilia sericata TaxID=13632 RepID=UPI0018A7F766|nr:dual specificity protein phosphatase 19 [Lucilia sericata]
MSFLEELKQKKTKLKACNTVITTTTGERFIENSTTHVTEKLNTTPIYGFVVDTKPDFKPAQILNNFLYLGSQDAVNMENIKEYKLTHILSIGIECPPLEDLPSSLKKLYVPCLDLPETNLKEQGILSKAFDFIEAVRLINGRILVHCNAGVSRSATIVIAYLMQFHNMDFDMAYKQVKSQRECIQPNAGFLKQLKGFKN